MAKTTVKIRGKFLQVNDVFINLDSTHSICADYDKEKKKLAVKFKMKDHEWWKFWCSSEEEQNDLFERIGDALELMGAHQTDPEWKPGNDLHVPDASEMEMDALARQGQLPDEADEARRRLNTPVETKVWEGHPSGQIMRERMEDLGYKEP
jgi:hypothetical protein